MKNSSGLLKQKSPMSKAEIISKVLGQAHLISPPSVALQVVNAASHPDCSPGMIRDLLSQDPGLYAKVLKTVNSCMFGTAQPISSVDRAVLILGMNAVRSLVLGLSLPMLQNQKPSSKGFRDYWISSVSGSIIARELAKHLTRPAPVIDQVAGLLRNIGVMLLIQTFPEESHQWVHQKSPNHLLRTLEIEERIFGVNHVEVGVELLRQWKLPEEIIVPIQNHHAQSLPHEPTRKDWQDRANLLSFVDWVVQLDEIVDHPELLKRLLQMAKSEYQLGQEEFINFLNSVSEEIEKYTQILNINLSEMPEFGVVLAKSCEEFIKLTLAKQLMLNSSSDYRDSKLLLNETVDQVIRGKTDAIPMAVCQRTVAVDSDSVLDPATMNRFSMDVFEEFPEKGFEFAGYHVIRPIGSGAMGAVFLARDFSLSREVAIKVMKPEIAYSKVARQRFQREARSMAAVQHENIVTIFSVGEFENVPYLVMECIQGGSLEEFLSEHAIVNVRDLYRLSKQIICGISAAHTHSIVHRDIKPANILIDEKMRRIKLTDFGLARGSDDIRLTSEGALVGSPMYMSPELIHGRTIDARSDLFSVGGVLYTLATGMAAFSGESIANVLRNICDSDPIPPIELRSDLPQWYSDMILKLLAKDPDQRFQSGLEVEKLLRQLLDR